ncbi:MAG: serpin family protein [Euryarchaeota archaeon]|nr:serpin family protein [Euryarchaeota archaeon]
MNRKLAVAGAIVVVALVLAPILYGIVVRQQSPSGNNVNFRRLDDSLATTVGVAQTVDGMNGFALDFYRNVSTDGDNVFFSPWSIETALAMTSEGARGQTASEMFSTLRIPSDDGTRRSSFASIYNRLNEQSAEYQLSTANALWGQNDYPFRAEYVNTTRNYYEAEMRNLDFVGATEESRRTINLWVENQTSGKIVDLLPQGALSPLTRLVLTNAIYFNGTWEYQFDVDVTANEPFWTSPTQSVQAPMMKHSKEAASYDYTETSDFQILEMPYKGGNLSMLVILPKNNTLAGLEAKLTAQNLNAWRGALASEKVDVIFPKFTFKTKYQLKSTLSAMGMPTAFNPYSANFSGIDGTMNLSISDVYHQAYVKVDEKGTEAAAATGVVVGTTSVPIVTTFRADHPFIFLIQHKSTGAILFMGKVANPAA